MVTQGAPRCEAAQGCGKWVGVEGREGRIGTGAATDAGQGTVLTVFSLDHLLEVLLGLLFHDGLASTNICTAKREGHFGGITSSAYCLSCQPQPRYGLLHILMASVTLPTAQIICPSWGLAGPFSPCHFPRESRHPLQQPRASPSPPSQAQLLRRLSRRCSCFSPFSS